MFSFIEEHRTDSPAASGHMGLCPGEVTLKPYVGTEVCTFDNKVRSSCMAAYFMGRPNENALYPEARISTLDCWCRSSIAW